MTICLSRILKDVYGRTSEKVHSHPTALTSVQVSFSYLLLIKNFPTGVATKAFQEDPVALVSGVSVGGILLVGAIVLLSLYIW